jgi:hypothetical protein
MALLVLLFVLWAKDELYGLTVNFFLHMDSTHTNLKLPKIYGIPEWGVFDSLIGGKK